MPKAKHADAISRQWEILSRIPRIPPGISANEIVVALENDNFSVTKRTIERDLNELSLRFGIVCNEDNTPYRWQWMVGGSKELPALTLTDALSLKLVEGILRPLLPKAMLEILEHRFSEAGSKLEAMTNQTKNASWLGKVRNVQPTLSLLPPDIDEVVLDRVQTALLNDWQLEIEYKGAGQEAPKNQSINPLALVQRGPTTYLVATAFKYSDIRLYAVHRIHDAAIIEEKVVRPKRFSIDEYISKGNLNFGSGKEIKLEAYLSEWLCEILEETPLSYDQSIEYGEEYPKVTATIEDTWQLHWWILSQGDGIEVCKPKSLRVVIEENLADALNQYHHKS